MARFTYQPHDQEREDRLAEEKVARKAMAKMAIEDEPEPDPHFGDLDPASPEFASVEAFAEFLYEDERSSYTCHELQCVWSRAGGLRLQQVRAELESYGLQLQKRAKGRMVRGFTANSHNLYEGNPMAGGGGGASIIGMAD